MSRSSDERILEGAGLRYGSARGRWVLLTTVLGSGMAMLDGTVVNVALPSDRRGPRRASFGGLQWTVNAYTLTLASLILLGGSLGDRYGRRRVFVIGVVWFAVASLLCGSRRTSSCWSRARALQGVGGALLTPGSLALISGRRSAPRTGPGRSAPGRGWAASLRRSARSSAAGWWSGPGGRCS